MTFDMLTHHLKGFHLALASYLPQRSDEGWRMSDVEWFAYLSLKVERGLLTEEEAEVMVSKTKSHRPPKPPQLIPLIQHLRDDIYV
jgi:hypothetical protein